MASSYPVSALEEQSRSVEYDKMMCSKLGDSSVKEVIGDPIVLPDGTQIPLSKAIKANGFVFTSGQLAIGANGKMIEGDIEAQTEQVLLNLAACLEAGGSSMANVVKATAWITDASYFGGFNKAYAKAFPSAPPARSTVVSGLLMPGAMVEIEAVGTVD